MTGRALAEGDVFYAVLVGTPSGFERRDFSAEAWPGPPQDYFCFWKSRVPRRAEKARRLVDDQVIINLFLRLETATEPVKLQFRFVLALLLMRRRLLKYEETESREGGEYWVMRLTGEGSRHNVLNPRLDESQVSRLSEELGAILRGDPRALDSVDALADDVPRETLDLACPASQGQQHAAPPVS